MIISQSGIDITRRFFDAIDILARDGKIRGLQTFTKRHGINRWNLITVKNKPQNTILKCEYVAYLCNDYNISPKWILLGKGNFYDTLQD